MFKSHMTHYNSKKLTDTANEIMEGLPQFISKVFFLSDIFHTVNLLNLELQGRRSDLVTCAQKINVNMSKFK